MYSNHTIKVTDELERTAVIFDAELKDTSLFDCIEAVVTIECLISSFECDEYEGTGKCELEFQVTDLDRLKPKSHILPANGLVEYSGTLTVMAKIVEK